MGRADPRGATLEVLAHPRAARNRVGPFVDDVLVVRVVRPALEGEANAAIRRLVADALGVAPSRLRLLRGERSRHKRYEVDGMAPAELGSRLARLGDEENLEPPGGHD